jgi:hypothetical protein
MRLDNLPPSSFVFVVVVVMVAVVLVIDFVVVALLGVGELGLQAVSSDQLVARW